MKRAVSILALLLLCFSAKAQLIYGTLTITNGPTNGYSFTIGGVTAYWTNAATGNGFIQASNTFGADATNLFNYLSSNSVTMVSQSSNVIVFSGTNTGTISTNWATLTSKWSTITTPTNVTTIPTGPILNGGDTNVSSVTNFTATFTTLFPDTNYTTYAAGLGFLLTNTGVISKTISNCVFTFKSTSGTIYWNALHP